MMQNENMELRLEALNASKTHVTGSFEKVQVAAIFGQNSPKGVNLMPTITFIFISPIVWS